MSEQCDELQEEKERVRQLNRLRGLAYISRLTRSRKEKDTWFRTETGPLKHPRKQYYNVEEAALVANVTTKRINQALYWEEMEHEQPKRYKRYILKDHLFKWIEEKGLR